MVNLVNALQSEPTAQPEEDNLNKRTLRNPPGIHEVPRWRWD